MLLDAGWQPESEPAARVALRVRGTPSIAMTYANAYGRFSVKDNLCGLSFAGDRRRRQAGAARRGVARAGLRHRQRRAADGRASRSSTTTSVGGAVNDAIVGLAVDGRHDFNVDGAICQRNLLTGSDAHATRVQSGRQGNAAHRQPARQAGDHRRTAASDTLVPVTFTSRAVLRPEQDRRRRGEQALVHRGHQRAALRRVHRQRSAAGLRLALRAAALLLHPGDGRDVGAT